MGLKRMSRTKKLKLRKNKKTRTQRRGQTQRRARGSRRQRKVRFYKGGNILPSSISNIGYSILGTGQSVIDGWNGKPSSYAYVNSSPESQSPINGIYQAHHNKI
jgi:hypothetical protein